MMAGREGRVVVVVVRPVTIRHRPRDSRSPPPSHVTPFLL